MLGKPKPKECFGCPAYRTGTGFANGEGGYTPKIVFIGEALGETEASLGRPFVGGTGTMLRSMIRQADLNLANEYITNVCKCRPPANRVPTAMEIEFCTTKYLINELDALKPNLIVCVGDTAAKFIMGKLPAGITKMRGSVFNVPPFGKIMPIVHPSYVARGNPEYWAITVVDLIKAKQEAESSVYVDPMLGIEMNLAPTCQQVLDCIDHIINNNLKFAWDLETVGERETINIMCIGLAWSDHQALVIPLLKRGGYEYWTNPESEALVWQSVMQLMASSCTKITQNGFTFDLPIMLDLGVGVNRPVVDTLVSHHIVATELPHSLEFLTSIYTNLQHYKSDVKGYGGFIWIPDQVLRKYNALDCIATYIASEGIQAEMVEHGLL